MKMGWSVRSPEHTEKLLNGEAGSKINFDTPFGFNCRGQLEGVADIEFIGNVVLIEREMLAARLDELTMVHILLPESGPKEQGDFELGVSESFIPVVTMFIEGDVPTDQERLEVIDDKFF